MKNSSVSPAMDRRSFLQRSLLWTGAASLAPSLSLLPRSRAQGARPGNPLRLPAEWTGDTLSVAPASLPVWPGFATDVFAVNGSVPGPTIRVTRGQEFAARIENQLNQPLVLHWHGILAPERMDGHPRDAVPAGQSYEVRFPVNQRASTSWYHAHTDLLTAEQVYAGVAGLFIVEDPEEQALDLPRGDHDVPLVIADRRGNPQHQFLYTPSVMDIMRGYLGDVILVNGTPEAWLSVDQGLYRFRLLNGSNARVFKIAFSDGRPFHLIGADGGLLPAPNAVTSAMLAPGERLEILVDFSGDSLGGSVWLKSLFFPSSGGMGGGPVQGTEMNLMQFYVDNPAEGNASLPETLVPFTPHNPADARRTRVFNLAPAPLGRHTINGQLYNVDRIDLTVPFGELEVWEYRNNSGQPHPMHMHATHFQVLERVGRIGIRPEDQGWKDTVLVDPGETVRVLLRFDSHPGVFVHHCHNLEHEDNGMMQNFEVQRPPELAIQEGPGGVTLSWPAEYQGWRLEATPAVGPKAGWQPVSETPVNVDGRWTLTRPTEAGREFYRLSR